MEIIKETRLRITLTVSTLDQFTYLPSRGRENRTFDFVLFVFFFCEFHFVRWPNSIELYRTLSFDWVRKSPNVRFCSIQTFFFVSFISFDGRAPSNSIEWKSSIEFENRTFDVILQAYFGATTDAKWILLHYNSNTTKILSLTFISWKQFSLIDALYIVIPEIHVVQR